jgi:accessory gene regulator B
MPSLTGSFVSYLGDRLDLNPDQREIARFGLQTLLYPVVNFLLICLAGWLLGCLWAMVTAALTALVLRTFSHGAHSRTPLTCIMTGLVVFSTFGKTATLLAPSLSPEQLLLIILAGFAPSLITVWRLAPVASPAKPVASSSDRQKLRLGAVITACCIMVIQIILLISGKAPAIVLAIGLGFWWQACSLTGAGHRLAALLDNTLSGKEGTPDETTLS